MASATAGTALMSQAEFDALTPKMKGYSHELFKGHLQAGAWLKVCPYTKDLSLLEYDEFQQGRFAAAVEIDAYPAD